VAATSSSNERPTEVVEDPAQLSVREVVPCALLHEVLAHDVTATPCRESRSAGTMTLLRRVTTPGPQSFAGVRVRR